jgi:hypothetical protein
MGKLSTPQRGSDNAEPSFCRNARIALAACVPGSAPASMEAWVPGIVAMSKSKIASRGPFDRDIERPGYRAPPGRWPGPAIRYPIPLECRNSSRISALQHFRHRTSRYAQLPAHSSTDANRSTRRNNLNELDPAYGRLPSCRGRSHSTSKNDRRCWRGCAAGSYQSN